MTTNSTDNDFIDVFADFALDDGENVKQNKNTEEQVDYQPRIEKPLWFLAARYDTGVDFDVWRSRANWHYRQKQYRRSLDCLQKCAELMRKR